MYISSSLQRWESKLGTKFDATSDKYVCELHFEDDQFEEHFSNFLMTQKLFTKKRKLKPDGCPSKTGVFF